MKSTDEDKLRKELKKEAIRRTGIITRKQQQDALKKIQQKIEKKGKK